MMTVAPTLSPQVLWSQRSDTLTLVINLVDANNEKLDLNENSLDFSATSNGKEYAFKIDFLNEINVEESKKSMNARSIIMVLAKKESGYWPKLTNAKLNFLKTDFSRWKDEDEEEEDMGGMGMPGMEGMDFSNFGGMGGMPGMGGMDMNAMMESIKGGANAPDSDDDEEEVKAEVINIVPAHRVYTEEFISASDEQLASTATAATARKLTRKTKVLTAPIINSSNSSGKNKTVPRNAAKTPVKEALKEDSKEPSKEHGRVKTASPTHSLTPAKSKPVKRSLSATRKTHHQHQQYKLESGLHDMMRSPSGDLKKENTAVLSKEEEIIRSKLLAEKEKEKSLMIQKYILDGKRKRLAQIREERDKKEAQRLELQKKLNALNDYRRSRFKVITQAKAKDAREVQVSSHHGGHEASDAKRTLGTENVEKVEYDLSSMMDYKDSIIERVSNISKEESSNTSTTEDAANKQLYKTLMVNIEMIKERIEQLANQSSSVSSMTETVDSASVSLIQGAAFYDSNIVSPSKFDQNVKNVVQEDDILDEPHISVLIQEVEKKCTSRIAQKEAELLVDNVNIDAGILPESEVKAATAEIVEMPDLNAGVQDSNMIRSEQPKNDPIWDENLDDSVFISDFADSKDLADESILLEDDIHMLSKDECDKESEEIGVGSLDTFSRKIEHKTWIDPNVEDSNILNDDYDPVIFSILAKKLLAEAREKGRSNHVAEKKMIPGVSEGKPDSLGVDIIAGAKDETKIQLSRKRRISATDSSFEVLPKKSNIGDKEQLRVLDIFQKKFIAKRHSRQKSSESVEEAAVPRLSEKGNNLDVTLDKMQSRTEINDIQVAPSTSVVAVPAGKEMHIDTVYSSSSGYDSEDISEVSLEKYLDKVCSIRKPGKSKKTKSTRVFDEPDSSPSSANSSFSKGGRGQIGSTWRQDSKKRLMDPRYRLSPNSLVEKYDAEISLSEVIDLSLSQVDSMVQGRRIAAAQEEALHLRNILHQNGPKNSSVSQNLVKPEVNDADRAKETKNDSKSYEYETSFDSISTDPNIKEAGSLKESSISSEYSMEQSKSSMKIGSFAQPLMSETTKFRILSSDDLMEKSIQEILDYKDQAKLYFQQEFVWLNMRERAIDFRYAKEQSFYQHERKRTGKKDKEREKLLLDNEQALEMKLVADKEDINRRRQKIGDKLQDVNSTIETVLGKLSAGAVLERSKQEYKQRSDQIEEDIPEEDAISAKVSSILGISDAIISDKKKNSDKNMKMLSITDAEKLQLLQNALKSTQRTNVKLFEKNASRNDDFSDHIEEDIAEDIEGSNQIHDHLSERFNYEDEDFEAISEISSDLKHSKASILDMLMSSSPITAEVLEAAEKIKKLNSENEKRKQWLAENMRKEELRLKEESKILGRAVDDFSRFMEETSVSNEALKSALHTAKKEGIISSNDESINVLKATNIEASANLESHDSISEDISEAPTINEISADEVSKASVHSENKLLNEQFVPSIVAKTNEENDGILPINTCDVLVRQEMDIAAIEAEYMEDFEPMDEIIEEMVQESDYNQELMDEEILQKIIPVKESSEEEKSAPGDKLDSAASRVGLITDAIWESLLNEIGDTVNSISTHSSFSQQNGVIPIIPEKVETCKNQCDLTGLKNESSYDVWTLSDEMPIELVSEIIMKIFNTSISSAQEYDYPIQLKEEILDSIVPLQASNRRREECEILLDLAKDSLNNMFSDHLKYQENISNGTSDFYLKPRSLNNECIIKKTLEYTLSCWSYSHENGENLDALLIKEVKEEERTWKDLEKSMNIDLKEKISLKILQELIIETTDSIYQLYKDVF